MSDATTKQLRAVIITGPGFQDEEYVYPYYRLQETGFSVDVATKDGLGVSLSKGQGIRFVEMTFAALRA